DQYEARLQAVGLPSLGTRTELLERSEDGERLVAACVRDDAHVVGVIALNAAKRLSWYRRRFADGEPPALEELKAQLRAEDSTLGLPTAGAAL
ncbi:MAG: oxidoreductase C-terminal domain-containing protein, partial [Solirubrobacteraceae bacterium]